jgi:hypothetical protein
MHDSGEIAADWQRWCIKHFNGVPSKALGCYSREMPVEIARHNTKHLRALEYPDERLLNRIWVRIRR